MPAFPRHMRLGVGLFLAALLTGAAAAQSGADGGSTGVGARAWESWQAAMSAQLARDQAKAEAAYGEMLAQKVSPLRIALLRDRTLKSSNLGGGLVLLEEDAASGALGENGKQVFALYQAGIEQLNEADDGFYFSLVGQFAVARANFESLLRSNPDPVALLEFVDRVPRREEVLVLVSTNPIVGDAARKMIALVAEGERMVKADPGRIVQNVERLSGPPRQYENSIARLKESGEFAVPFLIQALRDSQRSDLVQPAVRALPQLGRPGLNPMVVALRVNDSSVQRFVVEALGKIGYAQAVPYLLRLREAADTSPDVRSAVDAALHDLASRGVALPGSAAAGFLELAEQYYRDADSLRADPRLAQANVWYWRDDLLQNIEVPTPIFNEIMAMRCCEEALLLEPQMKPALALWLAANLRREAELPDGESDGTRPENYPPAVYFAQAAGPDYCHMALARALDAGESAVALGAIEALRHTAGSASILSGNGGRQPLAEALSFPDRMVRVRAALALGGSLPREAFPNSQNLMPVLAEAIQLFGGARSAVVIDPNPASANAVTAALRASGYMVVQDARLSAALETARRDLPGLDLAVIASDVQEPRAADAIRQLRSEFRFSAAPILVVGRPGDTEAVESLMRGDSRIARVEPDLADLAAQLDRVTQAAGAAGLEADAGLKIAHEAADVMLLIAASNTGVFTLQSAQTALLSALESGDVGLRIKVARLLGFIPSREAQGAIAAAALETDAEESERVAMFGALAESARRGGNQLDLDTVAELIALAESEPNLTLRTAASQALGALNLPGDPASVIIRNQYRG